jgi:hypothetical protein
VLRLDHVFVMCASGAPEGRALEEAGLECMRSRAHPGQGTHNRCWFVGDLMLELLWIDDPVAAASPGIAGLRLPERERWRDAGAAPFGVALHGTGDDAPFQASDYAPSYLPAGRVIPVAVAPPSEPLLFITPGASVPAGPACAPARCEIRLPAWDPAGPLASLQVDGLTLTTGDPLLAITADDGSRTVDLTPEFPLKVMF